MMPRPVVIGIAGGTGSGKTTIARMIEANCGQEKISVIPQDAYYKIFSHLPPEERARINFDHPKSFDNELLISHIRSLRNKVPIEIPVYDYKIHTRTRQTVAVSPTKIIIVEGILILEDKELRKELDIKIFVDTDADIRVLRRIERDIEMRGRNLESVIQQYRETVRPMHIEFVEPSKRFADVIIPEGGKNKIGVDMIIAKIRQILSD
ncbi:MAG: uridine kinase [Candidatus Cloacimonetes bacterium]|nr:uridine kinase [Candidatus Cloacimonadota bacterium]